MKRSAFFLLIVLSMIFGSFKIAGTVFICDSENAVAYHAYKKCRGLQRCNNVILEVQPAEATRRKLRPCKLCY